MTGRDVQGVLEESATVAFMLYCVWVLTSGHFLIAVEVFDANGSLNL